MTLESVEIVRGHDGFLRGKPEPVLLFVACSAGQRSTQLLGRALRRLRVTTPFPSVCEPSEPTLIRGTIPADHDRIALLGVALEEDAGSDVEAVFAALGESDGFAVWSGAPAVPDPQAIGEAARGTISPPPDGAGVRVLRGGVDLEDTCKADDWVGACLLVRPVGTSATDWRMRFLSRDGRRSTWPARRG